MSPAHRESVANRKISAPPNWKWYRWEVVGPDATMLTGCVSSGVYVKGPRKGRPKYDGEPKRVVVLESEVTAERIRYERESGNCGNCMGDGKQFARWDHIKGTSWRECLACQGTGKIKTETCTQ